MKTKYIKQTAIIVACLIATTFQLSADDAQDKIARAKRQEEAMRQAQAPQVSTTTARTQAQAIADYKNSGKPTGPQTIKTNPVPLPSGISKSTTTAVSTSTTTARPSSTVKPKQ